MSGNINAVLESRDKVVAGLDVAISAVGDELAAYTTQDDYLARLSRRLQDLTNERAEAFERATDAILALPEVVAAADKLVKLGSQMVSAAGIMKKATKTLDQSARVLGIGQQFIDVIAGTQKS